MRELQLYFNLIICPGSDEEEIDSAEEQLIGNNLTGWNS